MQLPVKFGVVGCGHIGKRHIAMIQGNQAAKLLAIADTDSSKKDLADAEGVPFYSSLEALIDAKHELDVLIVATPNGYHAQQCLAGLDAGYHIVCEKPMGLSKANCEEVLFRSLQKNKLVFCVMQNRYSPPSAWLKQVMEQQLLGKIYLVTINCFWNRDDRYYKKNSWKGDKQLDGGTLFTQFSHFIDIMFWLFGDIGNIHASLQNFNHQETTEFEDSGTVQFEFLKGGLGNLNFSTAVWNRNLESSITIVGEKGSIKVGGQYMDQVLECHIDNYEMPELEASMPPNDYGDYKGSAANHHFVIQNVIDTLSGKNIATTNALEGLKVVEIIERIYAAGEAV
jgi:predicted dehydrogenase